MTYAALNCLWPQFCLCRAFLLSFCVPDIVYIAPFPIVIQI